MSEARTIAIGLAVAGAFVLHAGRVPAFDSAGADAMRAHTVRTLVARYPFYNSNYFLDLPLHGQDYFSVTPPNPTDGTLHGLRYMSRTLHASHGGIDPTGQDSRITGLMQCERASELVPDLR